MNLRRLATTAAVGLFAISVAACGGNSGSSSQGANASNAPASLTQANFASSLSSAVKDQKSVHIEGTITAAGQALNMQADTAIDGKNTRMKMSMDLGQLGNIQMVLADRALYVKGAQVSQLSSDPSKPWVKIDTADASNPIGSQLNRVFDQADPTKISTTFKAIKGFKKVGQETVHGVTATHYVVTVDTASAVKAAGGNASQLKRAGVPAETKINVWVDSRQRPVEMKLAVGSLATADLTFTHWGDSVDVAVPPAGQVSSIKGH